LRSYKKNITLASDARKLMLISLASKRVKARLFYSPFNRGAIRTRCNKTPTKNMDNEAQLGAIT